MSAIIDIHVPDIGDFNDVPVIEIPVSVGDEIAEDDTMIVLESDKATLDVPSPSAGKIAEILVGEGDTVSEGTLAIRIEVAAEAGDIQATSEPTNTPAPAPAAATQAPVATRAPATAPAPAAVADAPPPATKPGAPIHASPSIRKFARELGVTIAEVVGSGPKGRITREDVTAYVKSAMTAPASSNSANVNGAATMPIAGLPEWPKVDFAKFGPVERQPLSRIAKISGPSLARNSLVIPHVCNFDKTDVTELEAFRKTLNAEADLDDAKLSLLAFTVKAVVSALKAFPKFNSSLDGDELVIKNYWNIGVAADTPDGLVVPVIKDADQKGLRDIAEEMATLAGNARVGKLKATDMQGATFTISSLGGVGGTGFTPIINAPEVAILGMTRAEIQPTWDGNEFQPRLIQPLSVSWDHRVVDGVAAARFLAHIGKTMNDFRRLSV